MAFHATCIHCHLPIISYGEDSDGDIWLHDAKESSSVSLAELETADLNHDPEPG